MTKYRVRSIRTLATCDGESSWVVLRGTTGTAVHVNHPKDKVHGVPHTVYVVWDAVLYDNDNNSESGDGAIYTGVDEPEVELDDLEFIGIETNEEVR